MRKIRKLCLVLSLLLVLSFFIAAPAFASSLINTIAIHSFNDSGDLMVSWNVDGIAISDIDMGRVSVTLQRYSGSWVNIATQTVTEHNTFVVDNNRYNYSVAIAGNYRIKTVFYAEDDGEEDSHTKYSSPKYVN